MPNDEQGFTLRDWMQMMHAGQKDLTAKLDQYMAQTSREMTEIRADVSDQETRIVVVENDRRTIRWLSGSALTAAIGSAIAWFFKS